MKKTKLTLSKHFLVSIFVAAILFIADIFISNRLSNNQSSIVISVIFGTLSIPLFAIGGTKALRARSYDWVAANVLAIAIIIGWTLWMSLMLYAFKDIKLVIPG